MKKKTQTETDLLVLTRLFAETTRTTVFNPQVRKKEKRMEEKEEENYTGMEKKRKI